MGKSIRHLSCLPLMLLLLFFVLECKSGSDREKLSQTDLQRQASDPRVALLLVEAEDAFHQGAFGVALMLTDSAELYSPELADIPFLRGLIYTKIKLYKKAQLAYERVLDLDPDYQGAWLNLGSTVFRQGETDKALNMYRKEQKAFSSPSVLLQMGRAYTRLWEVDSAEHVYQQAIAADSSYAAAYFRLSELYKEKGELELALEYSHRGLSLDPDNLNYRYQLGSLLLINGQIEEAIDHFRQIVQQHPWHYLSHFYLGQALELLGNHAEGERFRIMADSLGKIQEEIEKWQSLAELNPDQLMLWVNLGDAFRHADRIGEAIDAYHIAMTLTPHDIGVQNNLANLYLMLGDTAWAIAGYRLILRQDPTIIDVWLNLGLVYASSGKVEAAKWALETALKFHPDDSTAKANLAKLPDTP